MSVSSGMKYELVFVWRFKKGADEWERQYFETLPPIPRVDEWVCYQYWSGQVNSVEYAYLEGKCIVTLRIDLPKSVTRK